MPGRSFLKWTTLTIVAFIAVLTLLTIATERTTAASDESKPATQATLQVIDEKGNLSREFPLKHTAVKAQVSGFISRVTVTQEFENNFAEKIEAVYTFPLPQAAAVDDLTMQIGERTIKGKIMRREEAKVVYETAKQEGKIASLLDQERPNIFTQQVANIQPGQQITITISYVETLKYEDGAYEWAFPMVVGKRYIPIKNDAHQQMHHPSSTPRTSAFRARDGERPGHDISLEIDLDAGVPIVGVNSGSHETEMQQLNERRAMVRLKDRATIPNKDFVLTYRVAGDTINDAVLTHRSERGGFFTLILQPPQRVAPEDVMPKELVFVLDTSGSMHGFPLEKARQTMDLALNNLYPHDTFNLITFSGDTQILFPEPVAATPENLHTAKSFLESRSSFGGTEMMKAIKAALEPSDSQHHVRIVCFMTDGLVGNDLNILAEIQKHPNARVFAMGFGRAPNRFLLDKMAEYGRGDVDYVSDSGDSSAVARRFHDRIRNPLLHDLSIDWSNMPVSDIYPKQIPDLFSAKPVVVTGRYTNGAEGTIKLKGKMAGQDYVRDLRVKLPETAVDHEVLATLWARRKVEDLMGQELATVADTTLRDQLREEITNLGIEFKLMTQYTSFVAIDDLSFTGGEDPQRVEIGSISEIVTVTASGTGCVDISNGVVSRSAQDLPLQGRSIQSLLCLSPGVAGNQNTFPRSTLSINGQRSTSNMYTIDGVSANFGIAPGGENPGPSASGNMPALTASGGTNGIASIAATQEVTVQPSGPQAERGRVSGAQITLVTRSGTNSYHGNLFHAFGNDLFDASDWFANSRHLAQPPKRLNLFGGAFGGPIKRDQTFFFASYEGLRLRQPVVGITDVPSLESRTAAPAGVQSFLDSFPVPNGAPRADGFAEFAASFANPARHDLGSLRVDHMIGSNSNVRARYSLTDSEASQRGGNGFSLNTSNRIRSRSETFTGTLNQTVSPTMIFELHANYSRSKVGGSYLLDNFGGAEVPANLFPARSFAIDLNSRSARLMTGGEVSSTQRQFHLVGSIVKIVGNHTFKFGGDYRRLSPIIGQRAIEEKVLFNNVAQALNGVAARFSHINHATPQNPRFTNASLFGQDEWKLSTRLTFVYGLRWEPAPAPSSNGLEAAAVDQVSDPTQLKLVPGAPLWKTTFANFAPRAGIAYDLTNNNSGELVLRADAGISYDLGQDRSGDAFANSLPFISGTSIFNSPFPPPVFTTTTPNVLPFMAFDPNLKLPYTINWTVAVQRSFGARQTLSAAYVGASGKRLLHTETLFDQNPNFAFLRLVSNRGSSDYRALQVKYDRSFFNGLAGLVTYTWARTSDNVSDDSVGRVIMASANPQLDRGPSDLDIRHQFAGHITYELPAPVAHGVGNKLFRNWIVNSIFNAHSAKPLNVFYMVPTSAGVAYLKPDLAGGVPLYVVDPNAAGGRRLNAAAFLIPSDLRQGNLARNSLRGFPFCQLNLALHRKFSFGEDVALLVQADAFNLFNHTNFEDPSGTDLVVGNNLAFGQSTSLSGRNVTTGGFGSFYSFGGARAMRFSVKLEF